MARHGFGYTGGMLEYDVFNETTLDKDEVIEKIRKEGQYLPYRDAMEVAKRNQKIGSDPTLPERDFAADLRDGVARSLGIDPEDSALRYYTAVNSHFDYSHGVDAFFEYDKNGITHHVTLDATGNPDKTTGKANIIIQFPDGPPSDLDKNPVRDTMDKLSAVIADIFKRGDFKRKDSFIIE